MSLIVTIDWKFIVALGVGAVATIFALKMDPVSAKDVSIHVIDATRELAIASNENR